MAETYVVRRARVNESPVLSGHSLSVQCAGHTEAQAEIGLLRARSKDPKLTRKERKEAGRAWHEAKKR